MANIQVRVDDELKEKASFIFDCLGIDISTAIRMFLVRSVAVNGLPFPTILDDGYKERALAAMQKLSENAKANGTQNMTMEEIDAEIALMRKERRERMKK